MGSIGVWYEAKEEILTTDNEDIKSEAENIGIFD